VGGREKSLAESGGGAEGGTEEELHVGSNVERLITGEAVDEGMNSLGSGGGRGSDKRSVGRKRRGRGGGRRIGLAEERQRDAEAVKAGK
jgi:hypothetical protein